MLSAIELKEQKKNSEQSISYINDYKSRIEKELKTLCDEILATLDANLIPNCSVLI